MPGPEELLTGAQTAALAEVMLLPRCSCGAPCIDGCRWTALGFCWCKDDRDLLARLASANPYHACISKILVQSIILAPPNPRSVHLSMLDCSIASMLYCSRTSLVQVCWIIQQCKLCLGYAVDGMLDGV
jgi:hypothetical protein